ncbi:GNAT family N-acetyltransferase [Nitratidesulfovibrio termitidis]|uniref:GNAT family N-acetyltransferase n=1 Tax=Nitratidesulfovibrio termitidis TaxID=42252 RepID=UPI0018DCD09C|nr:GNAT family N-acetyltransferase [Nitratidesulfovibrio termitidis]
MEFSIVDKADLTEQTCTHIGHIYVSCGWGTAYDWKKIKEAFTNTDYYRIAINKSKEPIGFIRAFTDNVFATWLAELVVGKDMQRQGIGTALLSKFVQDFEHTAIYLLPLKGTEIFFTRAGLTQRDKLSAHARRALR